MIGPGYYQTCGQLLNESGASSSGTTGGLRIGAVCIEKQVPLKKTKCKVINDFSYRNGIYETLNGYPFPTALECVEQ